LGKRFWPLSHDERKGIHALFGKESGAALGSVLRRERDLDIADVRVLDAAYWVKGCSSLGRRRYAVLVDVDGACQDGGAPCLIDIKEAATAAAPRLAGRMPRDNARRVVEGARHVSPFLGDRMRAARLCGRAVVVRELLPQDLKLEADRLTQVDAIKAARYLAIVVGRAHASQLDAASREAWLSELRRNRPKSLDAPSWLWRSVIELAGLHEIAYLEHCRRYALDRPPG
jgi:uncharacterized protein (DUF2252 family)